MLMLEMNTVSSTDDDVTEKYSTVVASRTAGLNASIKNISSRRDALNLRLAAVEKRYRAQFTALDVMMSSMTQTSTFLTQQLANLPGASKK